jgi:recombinational DNA repair ATPase RecF
VKKAPPSKSTKKKSTELQIVHGLLMALSQALEETASQYVRRLHREIEAVGHSLPDASEKLSPHHLQSLRNIQRLVSSLQIKPAQGRRKDLKKIDTLIGELEILVETEFKTKPLDK